MFELLQVIQIVTAHGLDHGLERHISRSGWFRTLENCSGVTVSSNAMFHCAPPRTRERRLTGMEYWSGQAS